MTKFVSSSFLSLIRITDIIDIALIAFIAYKLFSLLKNTRAEQVMKGFIFVLFFASIADIFNLNTVSWLMNQFFTVALIFIIVVFQPELRSALERIGRGRSFLGGDTYNKSEKSINELVSAMSSLSRQKIGALVVLEKEVGLNDIIESGTRLGADISSELLINIFIPNTPLHDGAVIIRNDIIEAKVARDKDNLYFMAKCSEDIVEKTAENCMVRVLVDTRTTRTTNGVRR